jgi:hypothetical protein
MVPKPNGSWRPCGNYRRLNSATTPDKYPLPNLQDLSNFLRVSTAFSEIYLEKGYHQIPMQKSDILLDFFSFFTCLLGFPTQHKLSNV